MKKLVLLPIPLLLFVVAMFFACTKDTQVPESKDANLSHILSMTKGEDGILNLTVAAEPAADGAVSDRDGCTMYEAMRFTEFTGNPPTQNDDRFYVDVQFRLIKINKSTHAQTAVTNWITTNDVGGLNISWYEVPPLSDYWYATEYDYCVATGTLSGGGFTISDFWGDDYLIQIDPWDCDNRRAADYIAGPIINNYVIVVCTLNSNCTITGEIDPCDNW